MVESFLAVIWGGLWSKRPLIYFMVVTLVLAVVVELIFRLLWGIAELRGLLGGASIVAIIYCAILLVVTLTPEVVDAYRNGLNIPWRFSQSEYYGDANTPDVVISLIHGTWARSAAWTLPSSLLSLALRNKLDSKKVLFFRFGWSGKNSIKSRASAGVVLNHNLKEIFARYPHAKHFIIAHSHGGSVALNCLDHEIADAVDGIICLGTPVFVTKPRIYTKMSQLIMRSIPVIMFLWLLGIVIETAHISHWLVKLPLMLVACFFAIKMTDRLTIWSNTLSVPHDFLFLPMSKVIFIRASGDEASMALSASYFFSWIITKIASAEVIKSLDHILIRVIVKTFPGGRFFDSKPLTRLVNIFWAIVALATFVLILPLAILEFALSLLLMVPMLAILPMLAITIGPEMAIGCFFHDISTEPTPPGHWLLSQFSSRGMGGLEHSLLYNDPRVIEAICSWLADRAQRPIPENLEAIAQTRSGAGC